MQPELHQIELDNSVPPGKRCRALAPLFDGASSQYEVVGGIRLGDRKPRSRKEETG